MKLKKVLIKALVIGLPTVVVVINVGPAELRESLPPYAALEITIVLMLLWVWTIMKQTE